MYDSVNFISQPSYAYEDISYYSSANEKQVSTGGSWDRIDARVGLSLSEELEVYAFGKNLADEHYFSYGSRAAANSIASTVNPPRTYGVGVRYQY